MRITVDPERFGQQGWAYLKALGRGFQTSRTFVPGPSWIKSHAHESLFWIPRKLEEMDSMDS